MSFGYSIGDLIAVVQLANKVRRRFVDSPSQFRAISEEVKCLSNLLRDLDDLIPNRSFTQKHVVDLQDNLHASKNLLNDLDITLDKYQILNKSGPTTLGDISRRIWKRLKWEPADIQELRARLASNISLLNAFLGTIAISLTRATQAGVDRVTSHQVEQRHSQILDWLSPDDFSARQSDLFRRHKEGTGQWLLNSQKFKLWLRGGRPTLFCPGMPGAGKTMLTSLVVHNLQETFGHDASVGITYIYCNFKGQADQLVYHLLASLLKGLLQGQTNLPPAVELLYQRHKSKGSRPSTIELSDTIKVITRDWSRVFLVIDALDECTGAGTRSRLLKEIDSLQDHVNVSFFATSRFIPDILEEFKGQLTLEIRATEGDIRIYITDRMAELPAFVQRNNMLQEKIVSEVTAAVDGMFLLAKLNFDSLSGKMTVKAVKVALQELPKGSKALDSAYKEALQRIESQKLGRQELAKAIMSWIVCARKQLTTPELRYALAVEDESSKLDEDNLPNMSDVIAVCAGLVVIDENSDVVRLVHYTAQDFFERTFPVWAPFAEEMIAKACLTYLSFGSVVESCSAFVARKGSTGVYDILCRDNVLVRYAAYYWGYHAEKCWTDSVERRVLDFLEDSKRVTTYFEVTFDPRGPAIGRRREVTAMHLLAYLGLPTAMSRLLCKGHSPDPKATNGKTPLFYACCKGVEPIEGGQEEVVKLLLSQKGVDVNSKDESGSTPLSMAAWYGREAIVASLLDHQDIQINVRNRLSQTPLMVALETGHSRIAQILLERYEIEQLDVAAGEGSYLLDLAVMKGDHELVDLLLRHAGVELGHHDLIATMLLKKQHTNVKFEDLYDQNALMLAAKHGDEDVAAMLLKEHDIDINLRDKHDQNALMLATKYGHKDVVAMLLKEDDIDIRLRDKHDQNALMLAAKHGHEDVVATLLKEDDIDINLRDMIGENALILAAQSGYATTVVMLLENPDIQINCKNIKGQTALMLAAKHGHEDVVAMLLKKEDIDINLRDKLDSTALEFAAEKGYKIMLAMLLVGEDIDLNLGDNSERDTLMMAAESGHAGAVAMLLKNPNVQTNRKDSIGRTALMLAAWRGQADVVTQLLENPNVQTNCKDLYGRTALMLAAWHGQADVVTQLLEKDDVLTDCKDLQGKTALSLAERGQHKDIMSLLLKGHCRQPQSSDLPDLENGEAVMLACEKSLVEENTDRLCTYSFKLTPP